MQQVEEGTIKAKDHIAMAIAKSRHIEPLNDIEVSVLPIGLVIGGGIAGMTSALAIAAKGFKVHIVERDNQLGGFLRNLNTINFHKDSPEKMLDPIIKAVQTNPNIEYYTSSTVTAVNGSIGRFIVTIDQNGYEKTIEAGTIVVAVGGQEFKPVGYYNYKENDNVYTSLEFEGLIKDKKLKDGEAIAFIQCVGSREADGRTYCSLTCCGNSIKNALTVKEEYPNSQVFILYRDIRVTFEEELYYKKAREQGINFIQYNPENPPVLKEGGDLVLEVYDTLTRKKFELSLDKLVLATAIIAWPENKTLSEFLKVPVDGWKFFFEAHPKLRPIDFATDGIFVCGTCQGPKNILESMGQALGTASRALIPLMNRRAVVDGATSSIPDYNRGLCTGCEVCVTVCPYKAINKNEEGEIEITEVLCKGCGVCGATCVNHAIEIRHFTDEQILSEIYAYGGREA
jgi:heterodisulfide reductase subunit A